MRVLLLLALAPALRADFFESWHAVDMRPFRWQRVELTLHTQFRTRQHFRDVFQARVGPVVKLEVHPRVELVGGYYFGESEQSVAQWGSNHRTFGGFEVPFRRRSGTLSARTMVEHHFGGPNPGAVRLRHGWRWTGATRIAPIVGTESFFDKEGWLTQRMTAGIRVPVSHAASLDITYVYDPRRASAGEHRHVLSTSLRLRRSE